MTEWRKVRLDMEKPHLEASDEGQFRIIGPTGEPFIKKPDRNEYIRWMRTPIIKASRAVALTFPDKVAYAIVPPVSHWRDLPGDIRTWVVIKRDTNGTCIPENLIWAKPGFDMNLESKVMKALEHMDAGDPPEKAAERAGITWRVLESTLKGKSHHFAVSRRTFLIENMKWRVPNSDPKRPGKLARRAP